MTLYQVVYQASISDSCSKCVPRRWSCDPNGRGTGPFELTEINGTTSAKLKRFDGYWGQKAQVESVIAEYVPNGFARCGSKNRYGRHRRSGTRFTNRDH